VLNELPAPVAVPVASAPPGKVPVGIIVGFIVGALGALLIAGAVAYHFLPELFRMPSNPRAAARAKVAELRRQERDMDVPLLYPVGAPPPPPPPVTRCCGVPRSFGGRRCPAAVAATSTATAAAWSRAAFGRAGACRWPTFPVPSSHERWTAVEEGVNFVIRWDG
jgi:hypothetical protein